MPTAYINGTDLYYEKRGDGFPIIFIHPPLLTSANFRYQQVQLAGQFTVITFDIRGHGRSGASEALVTYDLIVEDMLRLLDHLSIPEAYVCGYSTGGSIALEAMLTHPDRFTGGILVSAMSEQRAGGRRDQISDSIKSKLALLPDKPGCYLMKNAEGTIIYVGKAKVLKNRVRSYFSGSHAPAGMAERQTEDEAESRLVALL